MGNHDFSEVAIPQVPPPKRHPYDQWSPDARALDLVGDKWTLLIIRDLAAGPRRFVELQRVLPGISTEQLRSRLNRMVADGLLTRQRFREVPPRVDYDLTDRARDLMPILGELARWGYSWAWGAPRGSEAIDITAIFRLVPGLVSPRELGRGAVTLTVSDGEEMASYLVEVGEDRITVTQEAVDEGDAVISGDTQAWIAALSPPGDRTALRFAGDRELGGRLLDSLTSASARSGARTVAA